MTERVKTMKSTPQCNREDSSYLIKSSVNHGEQPAHFYFYDRIMRQHPK
ncbi:hypothetical protein P9D43_01290 [Neobacillus niacini]|nr:hypothetical protein [Neobacillus niacini]MEC1520663.1 hypothetical protein [Neobacillus niacini]